MRPRRERGSAAAELLWTLPFILVCLLAALQLLLAATAALSADVAARAGARASSLGGSGAAAAEGALAPWLADDAAIAAGGGSATVTVQIPLLLPDGLPFVDGAIPDSLTRSATMPVPDDFGVGF